MRPGSISELGYSSAPEEDEDADEVDRSYRSPRPLRNQKDEFVVTMRRRREDNKQTYEDDEKSKSQAYRRGIVPSLFRMRGRSFIFVKTSIRTHTTTM